MTEVKDKNEAENDLIVQQEDGVIAPKLKSTYKTNAKPKQDDDFTALSQEKKSLPKLSLFNALLSLCLIIILLVVSFYFKNENTTLATTYADKFTLLQNEFSQAKRQQQAQIATLETTLAMQVEQASIQLQKINNDNQIVKTDLHALQRRFTENNVRHPNDWVLAEIEYLLALSGRKIWLEQDIKTAIALLSAADQRIVELNDASLSPLRSALLDDINALGALQRIDTDGIVLALTSLERRVDKLRSSQLTIIEPAQDNSSELSSDISDWHSNLSKSWHVFIDSFITVRKRDSKVEALLSPKQNWYLKENIRHNLAKAEFAIYRQQQAIYNLALDNIQTLLNDYFHLQDNSTRFFATSVQDLRQRNITVQYIDQLKSVPLLERILEKRLK